MGDHGRGMYMIHVYGTMEILTEVFQMSDHFKSKNTPAPGALMPADAQEVMRKYHESKNKKA